MELDRDQLAKLHDLYLGCGIRSRDDVRQMRKYKPDWKTLKPRFCDPSDGNQSDGGSGLLTRGVG